MKEQIRFVYVPYKHSDTFADMSNKVFICPRCGDDIWTASEKTGTGKLPKEQVKLKCENCGQWLILNRKGIERVLGPIE